ncbi:MAG: hypothetical protein Kow0032_04230 [Methyloligellaceae bacterium]
MLGKDGGFAGDSRQEGLKGHGGLKQRQKDCLARLARIEGQVRGISKMIEEERYCIDILMQLRAIKAALGKVENEILKDHADHCVADAIRSGNAEEQRKKLDELVDLFGRYRN